MTYEAMQPERILGWFHHPEDRDNRLPGILIREPTDGAKLELFGGFSPPPNYQPDHPIRSLASKASCASRMLNPDVAVFTHSVSASGERAPESGGFRKNPSVSTGSRTCTR